LQLPAHVVFALPPLQQRLGESAPATQPESAAEFLSHPRHRPPARPT
jgi:hypothetical protein